MSDGDGNRYNSRSSGETRRQGLQYSLVTVGFWKEEKVRVLQGKGKGATESTGKKNQINIIYHCFTLIFLSKKYKDNKMLN